MLFQPSFVILDLEKFPDDRRDRAEDLFVYMWENVIKPENFMCHPGVYGFK